ncbi:hypothetical protein ILYODFUR_013886 [Ilyodon furcidens]|uniref:Secreted protein n=1 Tax=Ilyodon furcidens TaxID=33524 RepID=A0ABV0TX38_9TELE
MVVDLMFSFLTLFVCSRTICSTATGQLNATVLNERANQQSDDTHCQEVLLSSLIPSSMTSKAGTRCRC